MKPLNDKTHDNTHQMLLSRLEAARAETDALFATVNPEALYDRPISERHRIAFYIGHLEAFDWNLLRASGAATEPDRLFAFGIDPTDGDLPTDLPQDWPRLPVIHAYRDRTRQAVDELIHTEGSSEEKLNVAIEHRLMHAETLSYILHQLPFDRKRRSAARNASAHRPFAPASVSVPAGDATLGLPRESSDFGWDNEFDENVVAVPGFTIDKYKVTNAQYLRFLREGGYRERSLWAAADREWRTTHDISHPVFWLRRGDAWFYRSMFDEIPLPPDWPVYVSHAEASAYARWAGKVLPTEAQWQRAARGAVGRTPTSAPDPQVRLPTHDPNPEAFDPVAVNESPQARGNFGVEGMFGNGWEWTSTAFAPFPGFQPMPFYPGYSEPFFDGNHYVLKGGSPRTASVMLRPSFRNWFQPHYQYVYAGFRCAERERIET